MKTSTVPIACGAALALMAGAAGAHWLSVRDMVTLAKLMPQQAAPARPGSSSAPAAMVASVTLPKAPDEGLAREAKNALAAARRESPAPRGGAAETASAASKALAGGSPTEEKLLHLFEDMLAQNQEVLAQNKELRERVADTNRDMMDLRFQLDSFHGQFRPLVVKEEPRYLDDGSGGVLPPLDAQ